MIINFECLVDETLKSWVARTNEKLNDPSVINNPFHGSVTISPADTVRLEIIPIYPDIWWIGILPAVVMLAFHAPLWVYLILIPFAYSHWQHSTWYYKRIIKRSLRKFGYTNHVRFIK